MADSIDRVFVHALNTVKKIPKTGAVRPPPSDRMRLYGLYKQAMEGDVDGVMERPTTSSLPDSSIDDLVREQDKWDAWNAQKGLSKTEAKKRYVEALLETMHKYANTAHGLELVSELEFVWDQVKGSGSGSGGSESGLSGTGSSSKGGSNSRRVTVEPMRVLSPMSEEDESERRLVEGEGDEEFGRRDDKRTKRMERAIVRLSAEIAALREQIATGREWRSRKERTLGAWAGWVFWLVTKHVAVDLVVLVVVLLWMRRRRDRRLEDHVRGALRVVREYVRMVLPAYS
ncbi:hypothetical protein OQA88_12214 [Cercophora sp. LCS_1]